ncbi:MAG: lasso peptide biosynthesis B2 protein [Sarcina sp.]
MLSISNFKKFSRVDFGMKFMALEALYLSALYRFMILRFEFKNVSKKFGVKGEFGSMDGQLLNYKIAKRVSIVANKVCDVTPWESKCLVRAMVAQKMLKKRGVETTLYLGVGTELNEAKTSKGMIAHAWLRYGSLYVTGGNGKQFAPVANFYLA